MEVIGKREVKEIDGFGGQMWNPRKHLNSEWFAAGGSWGWATPGLLRQGPSKGPPTSITNIKAASCASRRATVLRCYDAHPKSYRVFASGSNSLKLHVSTGK